MYSEKATKFCKISSLLLSVYTVDKSKVEISQNFVAISEYTNFNSTNNLLWYHGLIDSRMSASDKELPVIIGGVTSFGFLTRHRSLEDLASFRSHLTWIHVTCSFLKVSNVSESQGIASWLVGTLNWMVVFLWIGW